MYPAIARAGQLPPIAFLSMGYREAALSDFAHSRWRHVREKQEGNYLSITADFNGDGSPDEARVLVSTAENEARIIVVTRTSEKIDTYVLETMTLEEVEHSGIEIAPNLPDFPHRTCAIAIFNFKSGKRYIYSFDGEEFRKK
jgi:hypothetical protein